MHADLSLGDEIMVLAPLLLIPFRSFGGETRLRSKVIGLVVFYPSCRSGGGWVLKVNFIVELNKNKSNVP